MKRDAMVGQQGKRVRKYGDLSSRGQNGWKEEEAIEIKSCWCTIVAGVQ